MLSMTRSENNKRACSLFENRRTKSHRLNHTNTFVLTGDGKQRVNMMRSTTASNKTTESVNVILFECSLQLNS